MNEGGTVYFGSWHLWREGMIDLPQEVKQNVPAALILFYLLLQLEVEQGSFKNKFFLSFKPETKKLAGSYLFEIIAFRSMM